MNWIILFFFLISFISIWIFLPKTPTMFTSYTNEYSGKKFSLPNINWRGIEDTSEMRARCNYWLGRGSNVSVSYDRKAYANTYPDRLVIWDCNIITKKGSVIWKGNLDVTTNFDKIYDLSKEIGDIYLVSNENVSSFKNKWVIFANKKTVKFNDTI